MKKLVLFGILQCLVLLLTAQKTKTYQLLSPDKKNKISIVSAGTITWSVQHDNVTVLAPSSLALEQPGFSIIAGASPVLTARQRLINDTFPAIAYKKDKVINYANELTLECKGNYSIVFRAYNDGVAYRFITKFPGELVLTREEAAFNFPADLQVHIPYTSDLRQKERYSCSFEEFYTRAKLSELPPDSLAYLPLLLQVNDTLKAVLLEADVQDYPAMFVQHNSRLNNSLSAVHAPFPAAEETRGKYGINYAVTKRENYIARTTGTRSFPWRVMVISEKDRELLDNDMVQKLSAPSKIIDPSWIKPGKVAWDWWNDWNISGVDFKAGINTPTYKYYIDFASKNKLEYVVLDEGWSDDWDLNKLNERIDLGELLNYARQKNVGLILWSTWYALSRDIEGLCAKYATMGVKGFKVDFLDRNDQKMVASCYEMAAIAAKHHILLDFHGMFAPQGLQRTWPNVINFEGVRGMEYMKWHPDDRVQEHALSIPFIRMMAGPMDYTPGAFRNMTKGNARPSNSLPQSLGTRSQQMAMYIVYEAPLQMLADNPTIYAKEQECTSFIAAVPTSFNETKALDGQFGEYLVMARRKNDTWFVGGMTNWTGRDITVDLSFLPAGEYTAELFRDGINADRDATDYKKDIQTVSNSRKLTIHLAPGGGFAMRLTKN
jgi:alpha-glucosidase